MPVSPQIFVRLNPFINLFDPALHSPAYVRARCPLLFATLLMVGSKFWQPDRFRACQRLAEDLIVRAFKEGWKRVEVVQAFMCMTYWKEPDDSVRIRPPSAVITDVIVFCSELGRISDM
jgi:hypothetical protein